MCEVLNIYQFKNTYSNTRRNTIQQFFYVPDKDSGEKIEGERKFNTTHLGSRTRTHFLKDAHLRIETK